MPTAEKTLDEILNLASAHFKVPREKLSPDADFFKGLIQAAGAFVHLQKRFEHPSHAKHSRRLPPAVRLFRLGQRNLMNFAPWHHGLDVAALCQLLSRYADEIVASDYTTNPWSPETAPKLKLAVG